MKCLRLGAAGVCAALLSAAVSAAPILFNFAVSNPLDAVNQLSVGGITLSVSAGSNFNTGAPTVHEDNTAAGGYDGLGVDSGSGDDSKNDINNASSGRFEWLIFTFSAPVVLDGIAFTNVDSNDEFMLGFGSSAATLGPWGGAIDLGSSADRFYDLVQGLSGSAFAVAATSGSTSDFRITGVSVTEVAAVPEPASLTLCATIALLLMALARREPGVARR